MGLRIIYGRSGTGKSQYIYNEINKSENKKTFIITPEQFSFTAEQKLMENKKSIINAEVITFNRLAYRTMNEIGGVIHTNLTKCGTSMLIYSILQNEKLKFLNKSDENIDICVRAISEFKKHRISAQNLKELNIENKYLKNKLEDMITVYEKFQNKIKNKYIDESDLLTILAENIDKINLLKNANVYIDEFSGFTEQEYLVIRKIINIANNVTITFCLDNLDLNEKIFDPNKTTYNKIIKLVNSGEKIEKIHLESYKRFKNDELKYIENNLFNAKAKKYTGQIKNINLFLAKNQFTEIENVAKEITKLIKNENMRYKDISIITKDTEKYSGITKMIFEKYDIPIFIDEKRDLSQNIIIQYILSILDVLIKNYSYESVFNYIKTGFLNINENDIFKLEKYCTKYGIKNNKFKKDFSYGINEENKEEINYLNELRKQIINPLVELKNKINESIVKEFYMFLIKQNIEEKINEKIKKLDNIDLKKEYEQSFKTVINILDEINLIFRDEKITLDKFSKILRIGLKKSGLGKIPAMQDQVIMGDVDRSRSRKTKVIFIVGINDGIFPAINKNEGFFNDDDREILKNNGVEIAKGTLEKLYDDNFNIYKAFTIAEEKLFLSYSSADGEGKALRPSNLIFKIKKIFPNIIEKSDIISNKLEIINEKKLYEDLILEINKIDNNKNEDELFYAAFKYYQENDKYKFILNENMKYINYNNEENITKENIEKLYGNNLNTSVSKLEKYNSCPFSYFLQYILKLKEKEELKVQNFDTGAFMHDVINSFFEEYCTNGHIAEIPDEELEKDVGCIIDEKLMNKNNYIFTATEKYKLLVIRLKKIIFKSLKYIIQTLVQSEFNLEGTEVEFSEKGKYNPIILNLEDGKTVEIIGKIDRIDIANTTEKKYVRIIDYKSSVKNIDLNDVYAGLQLQLITYLDAVCRLEDFLPAGILYFNLLEQIINSDKKLSNEEIEKKIKNNFKMKGLVLADVKVIQMHDKNLNQGMSELVPAYIDKSGNLSIKKSNAISEDEFKKLQKYINKTIKDISKEIFKGNMEMKPYYKNKRTPCEYCIYKNMCGINFGICQKKFKYIEKSSKEEILSKI